MKRAILYIHRYLGIALSLLFVVWFLSGFVMIFHSFPRPVRSAYAKLNSPIGPVGARPLPDSAASLALETRLDQPLWRVTDTSGRERTLAYPSRQPVESFPENECRQLALARCPAQVAHMQTLSEFDMWIPWERYAVYFPIYKYSMDDPLHTVLYVSSATGEIVQETNRRTRLAAWFGAIPHWVYIKQLRLNTTLWQNSIIALSGLGSLMCLTGLIVGIRYYLKVRNRRPGHGQITPYKKFWMKWHHLLGLFFGLVTLTYVFSGMMSMCNVPQFIAPGSGRRPMVKKKIATGIVLPLDKFTRPVSEIVDHFPTANRIEWITVAQAPYYKVTLANGSVSVTNADSSASIGKEVFTSDEVLLAYTDAIGKYPHSVCLQHVYDNYYRPSSSVPKPLPVYRVDIGNPERTSLYVNPVTTEKVAEFTSNTRVRRWAYQFLHTFDTPWLLGHPRTRLALELALMAGGTLLSVTALVLTCRKLTKRKTVLK
ncbi:MAG: PepSY domain-containing protein [Breznakibacter sp.]